jgi:hypothetical protein
MPRFTSDIDENTLSEIKLIAKKEKRSTSFVISVLLQQAIKERNRKRKKNNPEHNPADPRANYARGSLVFPHSSEQIASSRSEKITQNREI